MTKLQTPTGIIYADFVEYVKDGKTFADKEYEKWLKEREKAKNAAKLVALLNDQEDNQPD